MGRQLAPSHEWASLSHSGSRIRHARDARALETRPQVREPDTKDRRRLVPFMWHVGRQTQAGKAPRAGRGQPGELSASVIHSTEPTRQTATRPISCYMHMLTQLQSVKHVVHQAHGSVPFAQAGCVLGVTFQGSRGGEGRPRSQGCPGPGLSACPPSRPCRRTEGHLANPTDVVACFRGTPDAAGGQHRGLQPGWGGVFRAVSASPHSRGLREQT